MSSSVLYMLSKLSGNKMDLKSWKTYVVLLTLGIVQFLNYYFMNGYIKVILITIFVVLLYYYYFNKNRKEAIITTIFECPRIALLLAPPQIRNKEGSAYAVKSFSVARVKYYLALFTTLSFK